MLDNIMMHFEQIDLAGVSLLVHIMLENHSSSDDLG